MALSASARLLEGGKGRKTGSPLPKRPAAVAPEVSVLGTKTVMPASWHARISSPLKYSLSATAESFYTHGLSRLFGHGAQLVSINSVVRDLMRHHQMVLRIDRRLHVVADNSGALGLHRTGIGIGQGDLFIRCFVELNLDFFLSSCILAFSVAICRGSVRLRPSHWQAPDDQR
jgi:hypothetical protein